MDVKVTAKREGDAIRWTIDGKEPKKSVIDLPPKSGRHTLDFHLDDKTGLDLRFSGDPFWVHENDAGDCPPQGIHSSQVQIVSAKPKKLSIDNQNSGDPRTLQYQLNVVDARGNSFDVDPTIRNGGGGGSI